jgi:iron complex outermembrane receptor protein
MKTKSVLLFALLGAPLLLRAQTAPAKPVSGAAAAPEVVTLDKFAVEETRAYVGKTAASTTRLAGSLLDVPLSITTVTRQTFVDQAAVTLGDALRNVAGVAPQVGYGGTNSRYKIRGFVPPSQLVNGFRQNVFIPGTELANIDQIEVLKGPASALFGRFEPGGVVNIVTKQPTATPFARVNATVGSHDFYRGELDLGGPLGDGAVRYRLNLSAQDNGSFRDFVDYRSTFVAPIVTWQVASATKVTAELSYFRHSGGFDRGYGGNILLLALPRERNVGEPGDSHDYDGITARAEIEHALNAEWKLRVGALFSRAQLDSDYFTLAFPLFNATTRTYGRTPQAGFDRQRDTTVLAELFGTARTGEITHTALIGAESGEDFWNYQLDAGAPRTPRTPAYVGSYTNDSAALYGQDQIGLGSRWKLLLGGRYDRVKSRYFTSVDQDNGITSATPPADRRRTVAKFSPRAGLTFSATKEVSLFASWGRSFRTELDGSLADGSLPKPSEGKQIETGVKAELFGGRLFSTLSAYQLIKTNVLVASTTVAGRNEQSGENEVNGIDFDLSAVPARGWNVQLAYAYTDGEVTKDTNRSRLGLRIFNTPRHTATLWNTYTFTAGPLAGFGAGAGYQYIDKRASNAANAFFIPSYRLYNAALFYQRDAWRLSLNVKNLADKKYFDSGGSFAVLYPGAPREFMLNLGYTF